MKKCGRDMSSKETSQCIRRLIDTIMVMVLLSPAMTLLAGTSLAQGAEIQETRKAIDFNRNWTFVQGDPEDAQAIGFDDSAWQSVRLPHDWAIAGPFDPDGNGGTGKLPWQGTGWYRKEFVLDQADAGKRVYFNFDGVMAFPKIYINGQLAGQWDYGYTPFWIDATDYVKFGQENVIAVSVDTRQHRSRWYPGAGIYRDVTMLIADPVHIDHWGTFVTTPFVSEDIANVKVRNTVRNDLDADTVVDVSVTLVDPDGNEFDTKTAFLPVPAGGQKDVVISFPVHDPDLWDVTSPRLYRAKTTIELDGAAIDSGTTTFGIRSYEFTPNDGFHLNGRRVQMYGVCLHHDLGPLGSAFNRRAMERELEIMREMGVNAIRTSHNPPARGLVELCDRMGLLVVDEVFDKWDGTADRVNGQPPLEEHGHRNIRALVMRDRNSPSVILWSIGNEIGNDSRNRPGSGKSPEHVTYLSDFAREYDPTRPITLACHTADTAMSPILDALDVVGYNYGQRYAQFRENYPQVPLFYTESASTVSTRGFYSFPLPTSKTEYDRQARQVGSYDLTATSWSDIPDVEFYTTLREHTFLAGEFVWTGFDYLGEPTPVGGSRSSYFGIVDLSGIPKDRYYLYRSLWRPEETTVHILPHWNWPDRVGENVPVYVYTNGDSAELFLNGKSLGRRSKKQELSDNENLVLGKVATASSQEGENPANSAIDGDAATQWRAQGQGRQWWQLDLGSVQPIGYCSVSFASAQPQAVSQARGGRGGRQSVAAPAYAIRTSTDGQTWTELVSSRPAAEAEGGRRGGFGRSAGGAGHEFDASARYVRIEFTSFQEGVNGISEVELYQMSPSQAYYEVVDLYRLRWNDVIYEPGQLRAVAYKDGVQIGQATMTTAGAPSQIKLTPDRTVIAADGCDLSYILVEMLDAQGNLCPLADNMIRFSTEGPVEIAGVGNGDQNSYEPYQADFRKLFYGKAMLIIRSEEGQPGRANITASSAGIPAARVTVECQ